MKPIIINDLPMLKYLKQKVGGYGEPVGDEFPKECVCLGQYRDDNEPDWVVVLYRFNEDHDCHMDIALNHKGLFTADKFKMMGRVVFDYIFNQANLTRVTSCVKASNRKSMKLARAWGMQPEGLRRLGYSKPEPEDMYLFGMLKTECPWI